MKKPGLLGFALIFSVLSLLAQTSSPRPVYLAYADAQPILAAMDEVLPKGLKGKSPAEQAALWPAWVEQHDRDIRTRLLRGDEDTLVNFLFFGISFTSQPRLAAGDFKPVLERKAGQPIQSLAVFSARTQTILQSRIDNLITALGGAGGGERLQFLRQLIEQKGIKPSVPADQLRLREYIQSTVLRVLNEQEGLARTLEASRLLGDPSEEFVERSKLFKDRGLSLDTTLFPNLAIEISLKAMLAQNLLRAGSIRRVAVVGPGLDFTDKQSGYDFYPQQTIQPFALMDTLLRLGLADRKNLEVRTLDLSPRINDHLRRARERAQRGSPYVVQLPISSRVPWKPATLQYWSQFGNQIGRSVPPVPVPTALKELRVRAVSIRPEIVARIHPENVNIVAQHLDLTLENQFDLIIGTNIFVYYDVFEQTLALMNAEKMLRPGGFLLSNNALLELPSSRVHSVNYQTVVYSDKPDDGDHIVWYRKTAGSRQ